MDTIYKMKSGLSSIQLPFLALEIGRPTPGNQNLARFLKKLVPQQAGE
jgi:hypothetical protein